MRESYSEVLARYTGPESYAESGNTLGLATAGVHAGPEIELRKHALSRADTVRLWEGNIEMSVIGELILGRGGVEGPEHAWKLQTREPGDPIGLLELVTSSGPRTPLEALRI
jgi:hypothetical protein